MTAPERSQTLWLAYLTSLIGGIIIVTASAVNSLWFGLGSPFWGGYGSYMEGMMDGYHGFMGYYASQTSFFTMLSVIGLVCGILVLIGAIMLLAHSRAHILWGSVILVFSIVSMVGMGGFFIGAALGIIGGALALAFRPKK